MDRRLTPANERVAHSSLKGRLDGVAFVDGEKKRVAAAVADLRRKPEGPRERQLLMGENVTSLEERGGWAFVQAEKDGYAGYMRAGDLALPAAEPTHWIAARSGHMYAEPDIKSPEAGELVFGNAVAISSHMPGFMETADGRFIPKPFLWPAAKRFEDPATAAQLFFGAPYLWGGNSPRGIDCSGLVQNAFIASGRDCPADSDLQEADLGAPLPPGAAPARGDLVFWRGHVGMMVDETTMIHANAHHMAVAYEPLGTAVKRIEAQGGGSITARKRLRLTQPAE